MILVRVWQITFNLMLKKLALVDEESLNIYRIMPEILTRADKPGKIPEAACNFLLFLMLDWQHNNCSMLFITFSNDK